MAKLGKRGLRELSKEVEELDPDGRFVKLDIGKCTVQYSSEITLHENIRAFEGEEEPCRALVVAWLCTRGGYLPSNIELEKRYSIGRPKAGAELDILVKHTDGTPYALIEIKAPGEYDRNADKLIKGQLFDIAPHESGCSVLAYATVEQTASGIDVRSTTIAYTSGYSFEEWKDSRPASARLPINYGEPIHEHFENGGKRDLRVDVGLPELDRLRKRLHDVLWRGSKPDNTIYAYVVKLFLAKIFDEKNTDKGKRYRYQIFYTGSTRESPVATFERIDALYREAYDRYLNLDGNSVPSPLNEREFSPEQIAFVVELLQGIAFTRTHESGADLLGSFFEGITREGFKQTKGLFFTHINLVFFILKALRVEELAEEMIRSKAVYSERLPYIVDPSCGSGTFLLSAMKLITDHVSEVRSRIARNDDVREFLREKFPEDYPNRWAKDFIYGIDDSELLAISTKVNMVLHRDGNMHVYNADGLSPLSNYTDQRLKGGAHPQLNSYSKPVASAFDVVVSNPPFSITLDPQTSRFLESAFELASETNSENLFLERWYQLLKPKGRLGVVLPESFFSTKENLNARLFLFDHFNVKAVVSLPRHAFEPWTPTRTSLLFAEKKALDEEESWIRERQKHEAEAATNLFRARKALRSIETLIRSWGDETAWDQAQTCRDTAIMAGVSLTPIGADDSLEKVKETTDLWADILSSAGAPRGDKAASDALKSARRLAKALSKKVDAAYSSSGELRHVSEFFDLCLDWPKPESPLSAWANVARDIQTKTSSITPQVWSFSRCCKAADSPFVVISVSSIGYKRTKRAEYERPNDLYVALTANADSERVLNLNKRKTEVVVQIDAENPADALSILTERDIWQD